MSERKGSKPPPPPRFGPGAVMAAEKPKDIKGSLKKLLKYMGKYKWTMLFVMLFMAGTTVINLFYPKLIANIIDEVANGFIAMTEGTGGIDFTAIGKIILLAVVLISAADSIRWFLRHILARVNTDLTYRLRRDISLKLNKLPLNYYDKTAHGDILSRITNDTNTVGYSLDGIADAIFTVTFIIGVVIMMLTINIAMTLIALAMIPVTSVLIMLVIKKSQKYFRKQQEFLGHVNGHVEEMYGAHVVVKAFNGEATSMEQFDEYNKTLYKSAWKANFFSGLMMPLTGFIGNLGYVVICLVGGYSVINGAMTIGGIQASIQYFRNFNQLISQMAQMSSIFQSTIAAAERIFEFLDEEEETPDAAEPEKIKHNSPTGNSLTFENITFGYNPDTTVIKNFNAHVQPGQKIAIVGPTGAGKTTIVKLLMRFYDVNSGAILIDGTDIRGVTRGDLRSLFGMVLQDTWLFNGTIADNIKYGKLDASEDEIHAAAVAAQIDHFVHTLPDGYDMVLNEETSNVSQGQKQLLTIARAILADPEVLILDEATSSVDTRTEILIQKAMDNLMHGRTSFIIAHRLSTIRNADLILVMRDGDIAEQGTHDELLAKNGFYAELYNSQFEAGA